MPADHPTDDDICVFEAPAGWAPGRGRDCSDEFLADGEQIDQAERAALLANRVFEPDWSLMKNARYEREGDTAPPGNPLTRQRRQRRRDR